jgi:hypothetical protein
MMNRHHARPAICLTLALLVGIILACSIGQPTAEDDISTATPPAPAGEAQVGEAEGLPLKATPTQPESQLLTPIQTREADGPAASRTKPVADKWSLWVDGPHLRGANIWQAVVIPELDGLEFKGPGPVGPPYTQADFNRLAEMGANYVSISGPGLFTEAPPYTPNPGVQANLDNLLAMIAEADMFATIGFRTGPGRSEFSLCCGGDPYFDGYFNDSVWEDQTAQDAWVEMWRYTAERYHDNPIVAGYKLMVEPNAAGVLFEIYEPDEFYSDYANTLYDWNQFYPRIVAAIREGDPDTPILVGGDGWSSVAWLPYLQPTDDPRTVYVVHQYEPFDPYTHQEPPSRNTYPGVFDADYDGEEDQFDRVWLDDLLSTVDSFAATRGVPVTVDEFGVNRWVPGAAQFMDDQMALFEQRGMNYALWEWQTSWEPFAEEVHDMTYRLGPDPDNRLDVTTSDLLEIIRHYWGLNTVRPSNYAGSLPPAPTESGVAPQPVEPGPESPAADETPRNLGDWAPPRTAADWLSNPVRGAVIEIGYGGPDEYNDPPYPSVESLRQLRGLGARVVGLEFQYAWTIEPPYEADETQFALVTGALDNMAAAGLYAVVSVRNGPGRNAMMPDVADDEVITTLYVDEAAQVAYLEMLRDVVTRFGDRPEIIAWEPIVEPALDYFLTHEVDQPPYPQAAALWNELAPQLIAAIREADPDRPVLIEPVNWGGLEGFTLLHRFDDDNLIYSLHTYEPYAYTHQLDPPCTAYPGMFYGEYVDRATLDAWLSPVDAFQAKYNIPIVVGEWGAMRWQPGLEQYITHQLSLFEERGWSWLWYAWDDENWDELGFELQMGPDRDSLLYRPDTPAFRPIVDAWQTALAVEDLCQEGESLELSASAPPLPGVPFRA